MVEFVTSDEAAAQLQLDNDAAAPWLAIMIPAISAAVVSWLKDEARAYVPMLGPDGKPLEDSAGEPIPLVDSNGDFIVAGQVKAAVLVELASQFNFRDGVGAAQVPSNWGHGYVLGIGATALLVPLRKTTLA